MESRPVTRLKSKIYLSNARLDVYKVGDANLLIYAKIVKDETNQYDIGDNIITLPIIKRCEGHIFESYRTIYIIVDKSI